MAYLIVDFITESLEINYHETHYYLNNFLLARLSCISDIIPWNEYNDWQSFVSPVYINSATFSKILNEVFNEEVLFMLSHLPTIQTSSNLTFNVTWLAVNLLIQVESIIVFDMKELVSFHNIHPTIQDLSHALLMADTFEELEILIFIGHVT